MPGPVFFFFALVGLATLTTAGTLCIPPGRTHARHRPAALRRDDLLGTRCVLRRGRERPDGVEPPPRHPRCPPGVCDRLEDGHRRFCRIAHPARGRLCGRVGGLAARRSGAETAGVIVPNVELRTEKLETGKPRRIAAQVLRSPFSVLRSQCPLPPYMPPLPRLAVPAGGRLAPTCSFSRVSSITSTVSADEPSRCFAK